MSGHRRISTDLFLAERAKARKLGQEATPIEALLELDLDAHRDAWPATGPPVKTYARLWGWTPGRARRLIERWKAHAEDLYLAKTADPLRTPGEPQADPIADPVADPQPRAAAGVYVGAADPPADPIPHPPRTPGEPPANPFLEPEPEPEPKERAPATAGGRSKTPRRKPGSPCPDRLAAPDRARVLAWLEDPKNRSLDPAELDFAWGRFRAWAHSDDHRRRDWAATFELALAKGWPLEGLGTDPRSSPEQARADRTKAAARAAVAKVRTGDALRLVEGGTP